ncbi:MAG: N-acetylmuramoyl-L-alanine amidase [Lacunisphaera sp.]|nr:N-acetylmuramoyl-L-alanine amidase [Lacunisphaera sp.]
MARLPARGLLVLLTLLPACSVPAQQPVAPKPAPTAPDPVVASAKGAVPPAPPPGRPAPSRPALTILWPTTRLRNIEYVSLRDVAKNFDLKLVWSKADIAMTLSDARGGRFIFEGNQKDFYFDNLRVFLGVPAIFHKDSLWVSQLDVIKIIAPLFRPADHLAFLPAAAPRLIVLDPGHGGIDPGTQNLRVGVNEKTFTLDVALRLRKILELGGWRVLLIRDKDLELSKDKKTDLLMRNEFANRNKADLFLSIHFNAAPEAISGVETYSLAPQFMHSAGDDQGDDMTKVAFPGNKLDYANLLFGGQLHRAMITGLKAPDRGYKHARQAVLRLLDCPGALVECAYLSNDAEARRVATPEYRQQLAEALATGVQNYAAVLAALQPAPAAPAAK